MTPDDKLALLVQLKYDKNQGCEDDARFRFNYVKYVLKKYYSQSLNLPADWDPQFDDRKMSRVDRSYSRVIGPQVPEGYFEYSDPIGPVYRGDLLPSVNYSRAAGPFGPPPVPVKRKGLRTRIRSAVRKVSPKLRSFGRKVSPKLRSFGRKVSQKLTSPVRYLKQRRIKK